MNLVFSELVPTQERTCEGRFNSSLARPLIVQLFDSSTQIPFAAFESNVLPSIADPFKSSIISALPSDTSVADSFVFAIQTRDFYYNNLTSGAALVYIIADRPSPLNVTIVYAKNGQYNITCSAAAVGQYFLRIFVDNQYVSHVSFGVNFSSASAHIAWTALLPIQSMVATAG